MLAKDGTLQGQDPILHIGKTQFQNANFPMDEQGRTYHLGTKVIQIAINSLGLSVYRLQNSHCREVKWQTRSFQWGQPNVQCYYPSFWITQKLGHTC